MVRWMGMFSIQGILTWESKLLMNYKYQIQAEDYHIYFILGAEYD